MFTALPTVGQVERQGQAMFAVNGQPTVLLYGAIPAYRKLSEGMTGADVAQLDRDLVALGDATTSQIPAGSDRFTAATKAALEKLQGKLGAKETGTLALGQAVFLPGPVRVTQVLSGVGDAAQAGSPVLKATSTTRSVVATLDASERSQVKVGDPVAVTLPDGRTLAGTVSSVGRTATTPSSSGNGPGPAAETAPGAGNAGTTPPTINIGIALGHPGNVGALDGVPVQVTVTTATVHHALAVPLDTLVATASGAPAVDVVGAGGGVHRVTVTLGLFDDETGLVQVSGPGLAPGDHVERFGDSVNGS